MSVEILGYPLTDFIWPTLILIKNIILGTTSVGLAIGACLLSHFLFNLSRLPKKSREYREMSYHLETDTFVRYIITIICLLTVNILFYGFFDLGKVCTHIGVIIWSFYFLLKSIKWMIMKVRKKGMTIPIFFVICISKLLCFVITIMFQTDSNNSHNRLKQKHRGFVNEQISLPLIPKRSSSRSEVSSRKEVSEKERIVLPDIQNSDGNLETLTEIDLNKENKEHVNRSSFTREVQEKLNFVLGEIPQFEEQSDNDIDGDMNDFEARINENKKILQQNRLRKDTNNNEAPRKRIIAVPKQLWERKKKIESLFEKRTKENKDQSVESKSLAKRKETIKEQIVNNQSIQIEKKREHGEKENKNEEKIIRPKNNHRRVMSHKDSIKSLVSNEVYRSDSLFDGIQNYLENPREIKKAKNQKHMGLSLLKIKREIEDKIKDINNKLGIEEKPENSEQKCLNITAKDWRRIEINREKLNCHHSNFEAEINRIASLQERSSSCLEQYLLNQETLLGINLHKKEGCKNAQISSE